jgi:hypothetical protein
MHDYTTALAILAAIVGGSAGWVSIRALYKRGLLLLWGVPPLVALMGVGFFPHNEGLAFWGFGIGTWALLYWRHHKAKEAAKRAKAMAIAANALGCTSDEVEALVLLHKLRS